MCVFRRLARRSVSNVLRVFADDVGMMAPSLSIITSVLFELSQFARISRLVLNMPKTVLVPLWRTSLEVVLRLLRDEVPEAAKMELA